MRTKKGFTLIELLVVIAIIALLLSILIPSLNTAKEHARRLLCMNNLKSLGQGIYVYTESYDNKAIPLGRHDGVERYDWGTSYDPFWGFFVGTQSSTNNGLNLDPINHGKLFSEQIIEISDPFYCPTAKYTNRGTDFEGKYSMEIYTKNVVDGQHMPPGNSGWGSPDPSQYPNIDPPLTPGRCRSGYQYWSWMKNSYVELSIRPIIVDRLTNTAGLAHRKGNNPHGLNALFGDGHVNFTVLSSRSELKDILDNISWEDLGRNPQTFETVLKLLSP